MSLIHDWNRARPEPPVPCHARTTRRCATGCSRRRCGAPTIDEKLDILHLIDRLGIETADIGLPGAGPHVVRDVERLAREIAEAATERARRTARRGRVIADIRPIAEITQRDRRADRVLHVHRIEPAAPVRGGLDARPAADG